MKTDPPWLAHFTITLFILGFFFAFLGNIEYQVEDVGKLNFFQQLIRLPPNAIGDTLAGIFGTLAFLAATLAIVLQSKELRLQRKELATNNSNLEKQRFDNLVFEIVTTQNEIVKAIDVRRKNDAGIIHQGRDAIAFFYSKLCNQSETDLIMTGVLLDSTLERLDELYTQHGTDLGHYFRFIHNAMKVIAASTHCEDSHIRIYRSLFSDDELLLIFYNCLSSRGRPMIEYARRFDLFHNLPKNRLIRREHEVLLRNMMAGGFP